MLKACGLADGPEALLSLVSDVIHRLPGAGRVRARLQK